LVTKGGPCSEKIYHIDLKPQRVLYKKKGLATTSGGKLDLVLTGFGKGGK